MIKVNNLVFEYPGKRVLHDISFTLPAQKICALVGPNGAGKTTLLRCISSLNRPFSGSVEVSGMDVHQHPRECHKKIAYLTDFFGLYEKLTVEQSLDYMAQAYGIEKRQQAAAKEWVIERLNLGQYVHKKASELSRGMRQRLGIAYAIIHKPDLILLDEPASGLDPEARHSLSKLLVDLKMDGMTLMVSSHILAELEEYSDEMLIIRDGQIIRDMQQPQADQSKIIPITIKLMKPQENILSFLQAHPACQNILSDQLKIDLELSGGEAGMPKLLSELITANFAIAQFYKNKQSMHDVYMQTVNKG